VYPATRSFKKVYRAWELLYRTPVFVTCITDAGSASIDFMAAITIRRLDEKTKARLRVRAAHHGRSMEEEAREILRSALSASPAAEGDLAAAIRKRFAAFGGIELKLPSRDELRKPPKFNE
jgi:antitoxin FitA